MEADIIPDAIPAITGSDAVQSEEPPIEDEKSAHTAGDAVD